eukprot:TRINITY_DN11270_c0_g1_i1.p1 TRINITY_DN11270_c0_g1~~TRINITY_DN11270_c0_g1_i1.p1  ORF type:complete len:129 (+),score=16.07 TRINITY_DN11270_c0_g1_i1:36-422(+)
MDSFTGELKVYENTYQTLPLPGKKFNPEAVNKIIQSTLHARLQKTKYSAKESPQLIQSLCSELQKAIQALDYDRYKIIVQVTVGEMLGQGCFFGSRGLWDTQTDSFATYTFQNGSLYCVATAFAFFTP